jgi:2-octaprenylphenol hydroxylase
MTAHRANDQCTGRFDVVVNGGGLVGLVFALLLERSVREAGGTITLAVIDSNPPAKADESPDIGLRVVALAPSSRCILQSCGIWPLIPAGRLGIYRRMHIWQGDSRPGTSHSLTFDAAEHGVAELGYIAENDLLRRLLWNAVADNSSIELLQGESPVQLEHHDDVMTIGFADGACVEGRLLVGADGAESWVREQLGLVTAGHSFHQQAIVVHVASERPHMETAWQRFLPGGPVALLPLPDGRSSVVWSLPEAQAKERMAQADDVFADGLTRATADILGRLETTTCRAAFPLSTSHTRQYTGKRFALIGDAAHRVHPLAGQGVNLGLLDAAALAETLAQQVSSRYADPGDPVVLRRYERWRKGDNSLTLGLMDALHQVFTSEQSIVSRTAGRGLGVIDRVTPLKRRLADHALGRTGDIPHAARNA